MSSLRATYLETTLVTTCPLTKIDCEFLGTTRPDMGNYRGLGCLKKDGFVTTSLRKAAAIFQNCKHASRESPCHLTFCKVTIQLLLPRGRVSFPSLESQFTLGHALANRMQQKQWCISLERGLEMPCNSCWSPAVTTSTSPTSYLLGDERPVDQSVPCPADSQPLADPTSVRASAAARSWALRKNEERMHILCRLLCKCTILFFKSIFVLVKPCVNILKIALQ